MPSYILVITKVYKPQNSTADNSQTAKEKTTSATNDNQEDVKGPAGDINSKGEIMFRILSLSAQVDESVAQKTNEQSEPQQRTNTGAVPIPLEQRTDQASTVKQTADQFKTSDKDETKTQGSQKSRVTSLIQQSSKQYLENKIIAQMEQNSVELSQSRLRDNILISIKDENGFIAGDESAISELDEGDEDE